MTPQLNTLFVHTVPGVPLTAELFHYRIGNGIRELDARFMLCRDSNGSVYLGICEKATVFDEPATPLISATIWDVPNQQFRLRTPGSKEQILSSENGILGAPYRPVRLDGGGAVQSHLGYPVYRVNNIDGLLYSPALEIAMIYTEDIPTGSHEYVVQRVHRGEPDLHRFEFGV